MNLTMLLEEKTNVKLQIKTAIKSIKSWFMEKMDSVKEIIEGTKYKIKNKLSKFNILNNNDKKINKDIIVKHKDKDIKIASKGDPVKKIYSKIKKLITLFINTLSKLGSDIIKICKESISNLITIEKINFEAEERERELQRKKLEKLEKIKERKEKVIQGLQEVAMITGTLTAIIGSCATLYKLVNKKGMN